MINTTESKYTYHALPAALSLIPLALGVSSLLLAVGVIGVLGVLTALITPVGWLVVFSICFGVFLCLIGWSIAKTLSSAHDDLGINEEEKIDEPESDSFDGLGIAFMPTCDQECQELWGKNWQDVLFHDTEIPLEIYKEIPYIKCRISRKRFRKGGPVEPIEPEDFADWMIRRPELLSYYSRRNHAFFEDQELILRVVKECPMCPIAYHLKNYEHHLNRDFMNKLIALSPRLMGDVGEELHCDAAWMREVLEEVPEAAYGIMWYYGALKDEDFWKFFMETIVPNIELDRLTHKLKEMV